MDELARVLVLILLCGLLYAIYIYQKSSNDKEQKRVKVKERKLPQAPPPPKIIEEPENETLGSLMEVDSIETLNSDEDSFFD